MESLEAPKLINRHDGRKKNHPAILHQYFLSTARRIYKRLFLSVASSNMVITDQLRPITANWGQFKSIKICRFIYLSVHLSVRPWVGPRLLWYCWRNRQKKASYRYALQWIMNISIMLVSVSFIFEFKWRKISKWNNLFQGKFKGVPI